MKGFDVTPDRDQRVIRILKDACDWIQTVTATTRAFEMSDVFEITSKTGRKTRVGVGDREFFYEPQAVIKRLLDAANTLKPRKPRPAARSTIQKRGPQRLR